MRKRIIIAVFFMSIALFFSLKGYTHINSPYTELKGEVSGTLTKAKSPYLAVEDIFVPDGKRLVIEPGVQLYFDSCKLEIGTKNFWQTAKKAQLIAKGTATDSILFSGLLTANWHGITFWGSGDDTLAYATMREMRCFNDRWTFRPGFDWAGICIFNASPVIANSIIEHYDASNAALINVYDISEEFSQKLTRPSPVFRNCIISKNYESKLGWIDGGGLIECNQANLRFENTLFYQNRLSYFLLPGYGSLISFINVTIALNAFEHPGIIWREMWGNGPECVYFSNSIIHHNQTDFHSLFGLVEGDTLIFEYTNVDTTIDVGEDIWGIPRYEPRELIWKSSRGISWAESNLSVPPMFTDTLKSDFTLRPASPCVDAGNPDPVYNDWEDTENPGNARWPAQGTVRNDMGAFGWRCELDAKAITSIFPDKNRNQNLHLFRLADNYPNPFNPETSIQFELPQPCYVKIAVFNLLGQEIKTLVHVDLSAGIHQTVWDGTNQLEESVSSGVYLYRIEAGDFIKTKKMMIIR
jgi:hypothetical protein